ncbi:hypothetical protein PUR28_27860 [Streptomyces sp. BE308]|uniref:hypothetical protein n=1 Tax=Streptomyces sp. BE308 TaxID=3002529 RepID=UPI002E7786EC|nr:hypothetical protein [Streptomyces sp. BE308]MEE1794544.1 hypothetical protein [Streptomyces sp. BE308]
MLTPRLLRMPRPLEAALHDSFVPNVLPGLYQVDVEHHVGDDAVSDRPRKERFKVEGPRFTLDSSVVDAVFPAAEASGDYRLVAPHVTLAQELLPWERTIDDVAEHPDPWIAILLLRDDEILDTRDCTVAQALAPVAGTTVPCLDDVDPDMARRATCRTVEISAEAFDKIAPQREELAFLVHAREVRERQGAASDGEELHIGRYGVVMANRLPWAAGRYTAHLVSLEGCAAYFRTDGREKRLRLISLYSWTFQHTSATTEDFATRVRHLAAPGTADPSALTLRLPTRPAAAGPAADPVTDRLAQGYVPLDYTTTTGETTFAWYRGPFTPTRAVTQPWQSDPQPLPRPDAALIYRRADGVYDLSYAAAWTLGRLIVLANANLAAPLRRAYAQAHRIIHTASFGTPAHDPGTSVDAEPLSGYRLLDHLIGDGLADVLLQPAAPTPAAACAPPPGQRDAPPAAPSRTAPDATAAPRPGAGLARAARAAATDPAVRQRVRRAVEHHLGAGGARRDATEPGFQPGAGAIDAWTLLCEVPFHYLVPDAALLPEESLRFFHIDQAWLEALTDGAVSVGVATTLDDVATRELRESILATKTALPCGMLLRSRLVRECPGLLITADREGKPVVTYRRDLGADVWLLLFADVPDEVTLGEPHHGLHFGIDGDDRILLRHLTGDHVGANLAGGKHLPDVHTYMRKDEPGPFGNVMRLSGPDGLLAALAKVLQDAGELTAGASLGAREFALQCVDSAQHMTFRHPK